MKKLNKRLIGLIKQSKGSFIAIVTVVSVGIMIFMAMSSAAANLKNTLEHYYQLTHFADMYVQVVQIPEKDIEALEAKYGLLEASGRIVMDVPMITDDEDERVTVRVTSISKNALVNSLYYQEGSAIENVDEDIVVVEQFARARNIKIGDKIKLQISGRQYKMTVKGIAASAEYIYLIENEQNLIPNVEQFGVVYVSKEFAQRSIGLVGSANEILMRIQENQNADKIEDQIKEDLKKFGLKRVIHKKDQLSNRMLSEELIQLEQTSNSLPILFLSIAGVVLIMMVSRMVKNDRMSIGVLKALGYSSIQIITHYTKYALSAGLLGAVLGSAAGAVLAGGLTKLYIGFFNIPILRIQIYYQYVLIAVAYAIVFCGTSGIWGSKEILKIMPAESMRPEAPKAGKRIFLERISIIWKRLSFSWKLIIKNAFRNKKRMAFILVGVILTCSLMIATMGLVNTTTQMFEKHFSEFQKMDYNINFNKPLNEKAVKDFAHITDIDHIEPKTEFPFELSNGVKKQIVNIIGLKQDTQFYEFVNRKGEKLNLSSEGMMITENLADILDVKEGDQVLVHSFIPGREDLYIQISHIIKQGLGMNAYMELSGMAGRLLEDQMITGVYINSNDKDLIKTLTKAQHISSVKSTKDMVEVYKEFMSMTLASVSILVVLSGILGF
ncbi:MAG: ABC transporter permease, partial [Clostridia bacterium]|nr:ABC transporter permease [Clostridia bacterium]